MTNREEYEAGVKIMDTFIGGKGVSLSKLIIVDKEGQHIEISNKTKLPRFENFKKVNCWSMMCLRIK